MIVSDILSAHPSPPNEPLVSNDTPRPSAATLPLPSRLASGGLPAPPGALKCEQGTRTLRWPPGSPRRRQEPRLKLSAESLCRLRRQKQRSDASALDEFALVVELTGDAVPDWRDHPFFSRILLDWYRPHALSLPVGWLKEIEEDCRRFFQKLPWPPRDDDESVSISACRNALAASATGLTDGELRFLRDQLYVLAEIVVDGLRRES